MSTWITGKQKKKNFSIDENSKGRIWKCTPLCWKFTKISLSLVVSYQITPENVRGAIRAERIRSQLFSTGVHHMAPPGGDMEMWLISKTHRNYIHVLKLSQNMWKNYFPKIRWEITLNQNYVDVAPIRHIFGKNIENFIIFKFPPESLRDKNYASYVGIIHIRHKLKQKKTSKWINEAIFHKINKQELQNDDGKSTFAWKNESNPKWS